MRRKFQSHLARSAAAIIITCGMILFSTGTPAMAGKADLPPKAKEVASKFKAYRVIASPPAVEAKRKQVIEYLGALLDKEAAVANLEGALAIRDLMEQLSAEKPAAARFLPRGTRLSTGLGVAATPFSIRSDSTRELVFEFSVTAAAVTKSQTIRCEISGAADDSGDRGLHYQLVGPGGKVAKRGFLQNSDTMVIAHETGRPGRWHLLLEDDDTALEGESPGNNGTVRVRVSPTGHEVAGRGGLASTRRRR